MTYLGNTTLNNKIYDKVSFNIDSDYAYGLYQSCKEVSFVKIAGINSVQAFLQFISVNYQNSSMSLIKFNLTAADTDTLTGTAFPCQTTVPSNKILNHYTQVS